MTALTLTDFLRARLGEDEAVAETWRGIVESVAKIDAPTPWHRLSPARVLAEIEAKRRILDYGSTLRHAVGSTPGALAEWQRFEEYVRILALPYADHPDYRSEWAP